MQCDGEEDDRALPDRAHRLFQFLREVQSQRSKPVRKYQTYSEQGQVYWLGELPEHRSITSLLGAAELELDQPFITIDPIERTDAPELPAHLRRWVSGDRRDPTATVSLREETTEVVAATDEIEQHVVRIRLDDQPEIRTKLETWQAAWTQWAERERENEPARVARTELFSMRERADAQGETFELTLAIGCLTWEPDGHDEVARHLITVPAAIGFDEDTGRLSVGLGDVDGWTLELDMLDPSARPQHEAQQRLKDGVANEVSHPLNPDAAEQHLIRAAHSLHVDGRYLPELKPGTTSAAPTITFAPALILRRRSNQPLLQVFDTIIEQLADGAPLPEGVRHLIEVSNDPSGTREGGESESPEMYLPLPANEEQRRIVEQVEVTSQVVVQGPPGTGKTHTIANLLSHLLANGKRVLITAQTERALREVGTQLPDPLRKLCVSDVGDDRDDRAQLKAAVDELARRATEHDSDAAHRTVASLERRLDELRRDRASTLTRIRDIESADISDHQRGLYQGTLLEIAEQHARDTHLSWIDEFALETTEAPFDDATACRLVELVRDPDITRDGSDAAARTIPVDQLPTPESFATLVDTERAALDDQHRHQQVRAEAAYDPVSRLGQHVREQLRDRLAELGRRAHQLAESDEAWLHAALRDVLNKRGAIWIQRRDNITEVLEALTSDLDQLDPATVVAAGQQPLAPLIEQAETLLEHLNAGGKLKGLFGAPRSVKDAETLLSTVTVDGLAPTTPERLEQFLHYANCEVQLDAVERYWPNDMPLQEHRTVRERVAWNRTEQQLLTDTIGLAQELLDEEGRLEQLDIPAPAWDELGDIERFSELVVAAAADEAAKDATEPLQRLQSALVETARWDDASSSIEALLPAVRDRDVAAYQQAHRRHTILSDIRNRIAERDQHLQKLHAASPQLAVELQRRYDDPVWDSRMSQLAAAWEWYRTALWLDERTTDDVQELQAQASNLEDQILRVLTDLTAHWAWERAVGKLGNVEVQALKAYALAVEKEGKGKGKYAHVKQANTRDALRQCRAAVPAWVMPLHRVVRTLDIEQNSFDVIIIDEASQAGMEASFLGYLAPKLVVVGDNKQVSPDAAGISVQPLIDLRQQYIPDLPHSSSWQDPTTSFFDQARLRTSRVITLREHFRCVPEIIGFSNRIAYEPDNVPLYPLRQFGTVRLDPIKTVFVPDGYLVGRSPNQVNPPEVDAVVDAVLKCCADPMYDGKSFGVISLTGGAQADRIEQALLRELGPTDFKARDLRCGTAADFQGSQRDVMFLSMVATRDPSRRYAPLVQASHVQRYNVAASRARDQMWVIHSLALSELNNREDMRFALLDYCRGVLSRPLDADGEDLTVASDTVVDKTRFDSLFEQHVYNRLVGRGYAVQSQWKVLGFSIDLVVIGGSRRLAIECDGDRYHTAEQFDADLARQRELERCGWRFFRLRGSTYYRHPSDALEPLWALLDEMDIRPAGWRPEAPATPTAPAGLDTPDLETPPAASAERSDGQAPSEPDSAPGGETAEVGAVATTAQQDMFPDWPQASSSAEQEQAPRDESDAAIDLGERSNGDGGLHRDQVSRADGQPLILAPYEAWDASIDLPDPMKATPSEKIEGLREIMEVEGPILGERLYQLYVKSAGGQRVGSNIKRILNIATGTAEKRGVVVGDDPLGVGGQKPKTFRLPDQPAVIVRELGPRKLEEVPPAELAKVLEATAERAQSGEEAWFRAVLEVYGVKTLTSARAQLLRRTIQLTHRAPRR